MDCDGNGSSGEREQERRDRLTDVLCCVSVCLSCAVLSPRESICSYDDLFHPTDTICDK